MKVRDCSFEQGQKVWFYNSRRKEGKTPKLQRDWEGPYVVVRKLSDVVYCIRRSNRHKNKIVHLGWHLFMKKGNKKKYIYMSEPKLLNAFKK